MPTTSSTGKAGGSGSARSAKTEGAALSKAECRMVSMSKKFRAAGGDIYVSESGQKREAID